MKFSYKHRNLPESVPSIAVELKSLPWAGMHSIAHMIGNQFDKEMGQHQRLGIMEIDLQVTGHVYFDPKKTEEQMKAEQAAGISMESTDTGFMVEKVDREQKLEKELQKAKAAYEFTMEGKIMSDRGKNILSDNFAGVNWEV